MPFYNKAIVTVIILIIFMIYGCGENDSANEEAVPYDDQEVNEVTEPQEEEAEDALPEDEAIDDEPVEAEPDEEEFVELDPDMVRAHIREALDDEGRLHVLQRTPQEIEEELGESEALIRQGKRDNGRSKEATVYRLYPDDATGLYIFFDEGKSVDYRMDSFHGVSGSYLERWFRPE